MEVKFDNNNSNVCSRSPLSEINFKNVNDLDPDLNWTRLATAGGDNVVRLWRVQLNWLCTTSTTATKQTESQSNNGTGTKKDSGVAVPTSQKSGFKQLEHLVYLTSLKRHEKPVNVVRWSPSGDYLASAGDDLFIVIWSNQTVSNAVTSSVDHASNLKDEEDEDALNSEIWIPCRSLRRHLEDIYDICWSPDERALISGSVDHSIIIWQLDLIPSPSSAPPIEDMGNVGDATVENVNSTRPENISAPNANTSQSGIKTLILRDHKHYVQGVAWDPLGFYVASLSSDRACRIYRAGTKNCLAHVSKAGKQRLFQDDSWKSFFRRLTFSPDGLLLVCPSGNLEEAQFAGVPNSVPPTTNGAQQPDNLAETISIVAPQHAAHIFVRSNFTRPVVSLPTGSKPVVAVRFCPQPFQLRQTNFTNQNTGNQFLEDSVLFYDTQQTVPFAQVSQLHYQALNDATWSKDGHLVVICSTDGYCSLIHFAHGELGAFYRGTLGAPNPQPIVMETAVIETNKSHCNNAKMKLIKSDYTLASVSKDKDDSPKVDLSVTQVCDLNKSTTETRTSETNSVNNPAVVDILVCAPKEKRRVQFTTLISSNELNNTDTRKTYPPQTSTLLQSDSNFHSVNFVSQACLEEEIIEITDSSNSQVMV
ncbi:unnamed protein product [Heterobilharzia americana]|nr:unnamed protein product [Heterobilharzia americana]